MVRSGKPEEQRKQRCFHAKGGEEEHGQHEFKCAYLTLPEGNGKIGHVQCSGPAVKKAECGEKQR